MIDLWLKMHGANERRLSKAVDRFFNAQVARILAALSDFNAPTSAIVSQVFRAHDEHQLLMRTVHPYLLATTASGAFTVLTRFEAQRQKSADPFRFEFDDLPEEVQRGILTFLSELESQPYWLAIQDTTQNRLAEIIGEWFNEGQSMPGLAKKIRAALGGDASKVRAMAIARTETTGAANAGHQASYEMLADEGIVTYKEWLGVEDKDERPSHFALNNKRVRTRANFMVAGQFPAPYPGYFLLPPEQRVNCRCTTAGAFDEAEPEGPDEEKPKRRRRRRGGRGRRAFDCPLHTTSF